MGNRNFYGNHNMNGQEYCESDFMLRNEESCKASSFCQWNTWEEGEASFNGQGRCWSDIGTKMCTDMFEGEESVGAVASRGSGCGVARVWNGRRCVPHLLEESVGSNSRASCMDRCQRRGDDQMDCQRRCESEESMSGRGRDVYRNRNYYGNRNFYGKRDYFGNRNFYGNHNMNGQEYCESDFMLRNEESCKASSCCQWNTWEEGEASFNGQGRCWSDIGTKMCTDMFEEEESVGSSSRCMNRCQNDGNDYMTCKRCCQYNFGSSSRCKYMGSASEEESVSGSPFWYSPGQPGHPDRNKERHHVIRTHILGVP